MADKANDIQQTISADDVVELVTIPKRVKESTDERIQQGQRLDDEWVRLGCKASARQLSEKTGCSIDRAVKHLKHRLKTGKHEKQARVVEKPALQGSLDAGVTRRRVSPEQNYAGEFDELDKTYPVKEVCRVAVNRYERDAKARMDCIEAFGGTYRCEVCSMQFGERYGEIGEGFIHVHHRDPSTLRTAGYEMDPAKDLVPVCPNCHAMLHTSDPPLNVAELREIMRRQSGG